MNAPVEGDAHRGRGVRIRHPLECMPFRPEARPSWSPSRRSGRAADRRASERAAFLRPKLVADNALGAVRINFRYAAFQSMTAAHSEKAGRDQYFEGPHETFGFRHHEIDPMCLDLQYQPIRLEWSSMAGVAHRLTFDYGIETQDGRVVFGEDKPSQDYFDDPHLTERLDYAENYLNSRGASLERRIAGGLPTSLSRRVVKDIFDARRTHYDDRVAHQVNAHIRSEGGTSRLGNVLEAIGGHTALALEIARAMMHHRLLAMPINSPPMPDTPVTIPPLASKGALRAFLAAHVAG